MTLLAIAVAGYALVLLFLADISSNNFLGHHFHNRPVALYAHLGLGALALILGAFQFLGTLRAKKPAVHRWIGRFYISFCLASGVAGFFMALSSQIPDAKYGFIGLAVAWIAASSMGYLKARARDFTAHREWMIRSYALTYAAVTLRVLLPLQLINGVPFETAYLVVSWACWVPNLLIAEWLFVRRQRPSPAMAA